MSLDSTSKKRVTERSKTYHDLAIEDMERNIPIPKIPEKVLIVGCGKGIDCELIRQKGAKYITGIDISEKIGQDYQHPDIKYVKTSATDMPFEDNEFDLVFSLAAIEHILDPKAAIKEMLRVVKKDCFVYCFGGLLWNSPYGHHMRKFFPNDPWIHIRKKTPEDVHKYYGEEFCQTQMEHAKGFEHINYMYSDGFNRVSIQEYKSIIASFFDKCSPYSVRFWMVLSWRELLTSEIKKELDGYSEEELFTDKLCFILRKT